MEVLTAQEAAAYLRVSSNTLQNWRSAGSGPPFLKLGRAVRYSRASVAAWAAGAEVRPS